MKKRFLAVLLSVMMVLTMIPTTVFANGGGNVAYIGENGYASLKEAVGAAQPGAVIVMKEADSAQQQITIEKDLTIELDGHSLPGTVFKISGGTVTISDRRGSGVINADQYDGFTASENSRCSSSIYITGTANVTLNNLRVEQCGSGGLEKAVFLGGKASLTINGGTYTGPKESGVDAVFYYNNDTASSLTINDGHFEANCGLSVNETPGTGGGTLVIRKARFVGNGTAFWIEEEHGGVTSQTDAERFLADSSESYIVEPFHQADIVIGSGLFVSNGFTGPEYGSTDPANPAVLTPAEGETVIMLPQVLGGDGSGYTYSWSKDGTTLPDASGPSYTIDSYSDEKAGLYSVEVSQGDDSISLYWKVGAPATPAVSYEIWVGGVEVTDQNAEDVLGDGTVSYDAGTNTLTLNGLKLENKGSSINLDGAIVYASIFANGDLNLFLAEGSVNSISATQGTGTQMVLGIAGMGENGTGGRVSISGKGQLSVTQSLTGNAATSAGIFGGAVSIADARLVLSTEGTGNTMSVGSGSLTIKNADITCTGAIYGLLSTEALSVTGTSHIEASGSIAAVSSTAGPVEIGDGLTLQGSTGEKDFENLQPAQVSSDKRNIQVGSETAKSVKIVSLPGVPYLDEKGADQILTGSYTPITADTVSWSDGWYVAEGDVTIDSRVTVSGDVKLILKDGANLTVSGGIDVSGTSNRFTVYAQSTEAGSMGSLTAAAREETGDAGIGSSGGQPAGAITINGGRISATGGSRSEWASDMGSNLEKVYSGAGIGGGEKSVCSVITINGGDITASVTGARADESNSAAIGNGGYSSNDRFDLEGKTGGEITITGGVVRAIAGGYSNGAGIGGGELCAIQSIIITGGSISANSKYGAGIGAGDYGDSGTVLISGGTIVAESDAGCGIGGGYGADIASVTITGGVIQASASGSGAGIGSCAYESSAQVTISGGVVTATSTRGDGIGNDAYSDEPSISFSTGENGNAVIFASNIDCKNGREGWEGLIFEGTDGKIYGDSYTVNGTLTIPAGKTLTIENGKTLEVPESASVTNNGAIHVNAGGSYSGAHPANPEAYQVDWDTDGDGTADDTTYVVYGSMPSHEDGSKPEDAQYSYAFTGWSPALSAITGTAVYTAQFTQTVNQYKVTLPVGDGYTVTAAGSTTVAYNSEFVFTVNIKDGYSMTDSFAVKANGTKLTAEPDGRYKVTVTGNTAITVEGVADLTAPADLTVSYGTDRFKEFMNTITFGLFFKDTVTVTISAADTGSGVKEFTYQLGDGEIKTAAAENGSITFTVQPEFRGSIKNVTAADHAGNTSEGIDYEYFAVEKSNPSGVMVDTNGYVSGSWTDGSVTVTVSGSEAISGIAKYQYSTDNGQSWQDMTAVEKTDAAAENPLNVTKARLTVDNSGVYIFRAVSNVGNESAPSAAVTVNVDKTAPAIVVRGNTDDYLTKDTVQITATAGASGVTKVEVEKDGVWTDITAGYKNGYTVTENGAYTFRVTNGVGKTAVASITYDKIDPVKPVAVINSNGYTAGTWTNRDVTLSVSNTAGNLGTATFQYKVDNGEWQNYTGAVAVSAETQGTTYTFKAISASGAESDEASIVVKIDKTVPDGDIKIEENSVKKFINSITFGLFFNKNVDVTVTGTDGLSGVAAVEYYRSEEILTEDQVKAISAWTEDTAISETAVDAEKFVYYVKVTDKAGNAAYFASDGVTFDLTAPVISGIEDGKTYCTEAKFTVEEAHLDTVKSGETILTADKNGVYTLTAGTYTIAATDKAGNTSGEITVTVNPGHTPQADDGDCTTAVACTVCGEVMKAAQAHSFTNYVSDQNATCTQNGTKTAACDHEGCTATDTVEDAGTALEHSYGEPEWDWSEDGKNAKAIFICKHDDTHTEEVTADVTGEVKEEASCTKKGTTTYTARAVFGGREYIAEKDVEDIPAPGHQFENGVCTECSEVDPEYKEHEAAEGSDSSWNKGDDDGVSVGIPPEIGTVNHVAIDGEKLTEGKDYTVEDGKVVLNPDFLEKLGEGKHTVIVNGENGYVKTTVTVEKKAAVPPSAPDSDAPQTGDSTNPVIWLMLLLASFGSLSAALLYRRNSRKTEK